MKYQYNVVSSTSAGFSNVEYTNEQLGSVIKAIFLPSDISDNTRKRLIVEQFPYEMFYSRYLITQGIPVPEPISGEIDINFRSRFYDTQVNVGTMVDVDEKKSHSI